MGAETYRTLALIPVNNEGSRMREVIEQTQKYVNKVMVYDDAPTRVHYNKIKPLNLLRHIATVLKSTLSNIGA